jgi:hypothetical protein
MVKISHQIQHIVKILGIVLNAAPLHTDINSSGSTQ